MNPKFPRRSTNRSLGKVCCSEGKLLLPPPPNGSVSPRAGNGTHIHVEKCCLTCETKRFCRFQRKHFSARCIRGLERQLPKLHTRVRFPSPAHRGCEDLRGVARQKCFRFRAQNTILFATKLFSFCCVATTYMAKRILSRRCSRMLFTTPPTPKIKFSSILHG